MLLYRYIEGGRNLLQVSKGYFERCDLCNGATGEKTLSFEAFVSYSFENQWFSKEK